MSLTSVFKLFRNLNLVNHEDELKYIAESAGLKSDKGSLKYKDFVGLFAKPVLYSALVNLTHLLIKDMKYSGNNLAVKLSNYQREIYLKGLKDYIDDDMKTVLKNVQDLLIIDKNCNDMALYFIVLRSRILEKSMKREDPRTRIRQLFEKKETKDESVHSQDSDKIKDIESALSIKSKRKFTII